ncbi:putative branched-subunit amino acid permease [Sphingomonas kyeonggiensis]|uniref:hypothetical protein n=1 Tax=Sphingomonas kyeonggiensis TaxID=1268553 RepID=UPI002783FE9B|nr:hypothetical protein [Sphingomonas kyeonggiensis]MDQ0248388.1 putative branched-subunit amino acid permease [Sphingomonas kyeonggiensis]
MLAFWLLFALVPPLVGYLLGRSLHGRLQLALLALFLAVPPLIFTAWIATAEPSPGGFFLWWSIGMGIILVPEVIWATGTLVGFTIGKQNIR